MRVCRGTVYLLIGYLLGGTQPGHIRDLRKRKTQPYTGPRPYQARWRHPEDSRKRRERSFATLREARIWLDAQGTDAERGTWTDPNLGRETHAAIAAEWQASRVKQGPRTLLAHDSALNAHILPAFGKRRIAGIDAANLDEWVKELSTQCTTRFGVLRSVMTFAVRRRYIAVNPCSDVELPSKSNRDFDPRALTDLQVHRLANAMADVRFRVAVLVAAYCGLRANELWALGVERGDLPNACEGRAVAEGAVGAPLVVVAHPVWQRGPTGLA
jgi:hypothetical protein